MTYYIMMNTDERLLKDRYKVIEECETLEEAIYSIQYRRNHDEKGNIIDPYEFFESLTDNEDDGGYCDYYIDEVFEDGSLWERYYIGLDGCIYKMIHM